MNAVEANIPLFGDTAIADMANQGGFNNSEPRQARSGVSAAIQSGDFVKAKRNLQRSGQPRIQNQQYLSH